MYRVLPIWFAPDRKNGILIKHDKGMLIHEGGMDLDMELYEMTGIRLWEDRWKGKTAEQVLEEYTPGLWH
jgi:hypothetical protein